MNGLRSAINFLTILPIAPRSSAENLAAARIWFPLVGLLLGAILAGADLLLNGPFPPLLTSALLTAALAAMTRALHLDGFMDTCDALLGGFERERRLKILRDVFRRRCSVEPTPGKLCLQRKESALGSGTKRTPRQP